MNYDEALSYIHSFKRTSGAPTLERIKTLLSLMGSPEKSFPSIHVAGTNGKGSFCAMTESILRESGYKTALYTSPFIERFNERIRVCGAEIPDSELADITAFVKENVGKMTDMPTEFDVTTAIGFEYFKRQGVDVAVIETGLGGRFDATNVFASPLLSVITGIALDHTELLGDTVEKIAYEKAGIIKTNVPVLFGGNDEGALAVIENVAFEAGSPVFVTDSGKIKSENADTHGTLFSYKNWEHIRLCLLGTYQMQNAANVLEAVELLRERGMDIPDGAVYRGLESARWKARFERLTDSPEIFYDGAHNPQGVAGAVDTVKHYFGGEKVIVIMGVMRDKDYDVMAQMIAQIARRVYTLTPESYRSLDAEALAEIFKKYGVDAIAADDIDDCVARAKKDALESGEKIVALGSLYLYGDFKKAAL